MGGAAPWIVVGAGALVLACVATVLAVVIRIVRRGQAVAAVPTARAALESALADGGADEDALMAHFLAAAIEATGASAAAATWLSASGRRRSYSANLEIEAARHVVHELAEARASAVVRGRDADATAPLAHYERLIVPIRSGGRVGALGVYWDDVQAPDPAAVAAELEDLVTAAFPADAPQAEPSQPAGHVAFDVTLELVPLVRAIAEAAVGRCAADGAAVSVHEPSEHGQVIATLHLADYEERWVEPIVSAATAGPSITRYVDPDGSVPEDDDGAIATTIVVPLRDADGDQVGNVVAVWRRDLRNEVDARLAELEAIVQDARAVLDNAIRFRRLQALAVRDPATGVFDQRYFAGALADACAAADLHADPLLVVTVAAVDLGPATTPVEVAALDRSLAGTAARFAAAVGERGVTCRANLGTFAAIVPGGTATQGSELVDEIRALLSAPPADEPPVTWHLGFVERAPAEDADALWRRALDALVPAREPSQLARAAAT